MAGRRPDSYWTRGKARLARHRPLQNEEEIEEARDAEHREYMVIKKELEDPEYAEKIRKIKQEPSTWYNI